VERLEGRLVHLVEGVSAALALEGRPVDVGRSPLEAEADALAQLCCRRLGEGDGRHLAEADPPGHHEVRHPRHQGRGLAGAGPRLYEQRGVEVGGDARPLDEVGDRTVLDQVDAALPAHGAAPASWPATSWPMARSARHGARAGSSALRRSARTRSTRHTRS